MSKENAMYCTECNVIKRNGECFCEPDHPKGREPCPELADDSMRCSLELKDGKWQMMNRASRYEALADYPEFKVVPCLVTPLLTASEREKLIGEGQ